MVEVLRDRVQTLEQMADRAIYLYAEPENYVESAASKHLVAAAVPGLQRLRDLLADLPDWEAEPINQCIKQVVEELSVKFPAVALPLRVALSGDTATPSIDITVKLVGQSRTLQRIDRAIGYIEAKA